jgi:hypothetical protein
MLEVAPSKRQVNIASYQYIYYFWCCGSLNFVVPLIFSIVFMFLA